MARPVKWSRDLHSIRERALRSRTETWSRRDLEILFDVGRATAQGLTKVIGEVNSVAGAHFVDRSSLLAFLEEMITAPVFEEAFHERLLKAEAPPPRKPLRVAIPQDLRNMRLEDLPPSIRLSPGRLEIDADSAIAMVEQLALLAQALQNDLDQVQLLLDPPAMPPEVEDADLKAFLNELRSAN